MRIRVKPTPRVNSTFIKMIIKTSWTENTKRTARFITLQNPSWHSGRTRNYKQMSIITMVEEHSAFIKFVQQLLNESENYIQLVLSIVL